METGDRIRSRRKELKMTQEELAAKLGVQKSAVAKYENSRIINLKRSTIEKLSQELQCDPAWLLGFQEDIRRPEGTSGDPMISAISGYLSADKDLYRLFQLAIHAAPEAVREAAGLLAAHPLNTIS